MEEIITQKYLKNLGWVRDTTCPEDVNRWENKNPHEITTNEWWVSITFKDEFGKLPMYGVANYHDSKHDITIHRSFEKDKDKNRTKINFAFLHFKYIEGYMNVNELRKLMDKEYK